MKGGAYLGFGAYESLVREGKQTPLPIRFLFVSDEEVGSPSSRQLIEDAADNAKYVLDALGALTRAAREMAKSQVMRRFISISGASAGSWLGDCEKVLIFR